MAEEELRRRAVDLAGTLAGIGANPAIPARRARYLELIGAHGADGEALGNRSNAVLFATGVLRALGLPLPAALAPAPAMDGILPSYFQRFSKAKAAARLADLTELRRRTPPPAPDAPEASAPPKAKLDHVKLGAPHADFTSVARHPLSDLRAVPGAHDVPPVTSVVTETVPPARARTPVADISAFSGIDLAAVAVDRAVAYDRRRLIEWAQRLGAWVAWSGGPDAAALTPRPGDLVFSGHPGSQGRVLLARQVARGSGIWLESVDGGDRDAAGFPVLLARRHVLLDGLDIVVGSKSGASEPVDVAGWIDLGKLAAALQPAATHVDPGTQPPVVLPPEEQEPDPATPEGLRRAAVEIARSVVGLGANPDDPGACTHYGELIGPDESPAMRHDMMIMSGCALTVAGIWRLLGLTAPELAAPYVIGSAVSRLKRLADHAGAWVHPAPGLLPAPGDMVLVGGVGGGGPEHVYTVLSVTPGEPPQLESVDGGQHDPENFQSILAKQRHWKDGKDLVQLGSDPGAASGAGRGVVGWADIVRISAFLGNTTSAEPPVTTPPVTTPTGGWEEYAASAGAATAGAALPTALLDAIRAARAAVPLGPHLIPIKKDKPSEELKGYMYIGRADPDHLRYLGDYLTAAAAPDSALDRRKIEAFRAFLNREGSTAAINTYDNMLVTWGVGFAGLGLLSAVMDLLLDSPPVVDFFHDVGLRWDGDSYGVVDLATARVVSGLRPALEVLRGSIELIRALMQAARGPATRDAVTLAQLTVFMANSAKHAGGDAVATQGLYNFVTHLKHWAPGYANNAIPWALAQLGDPLSSPARDQALAPLIGRYFYGKAHGKSWIPKWSQFLGYVNDMRTDGLDCTGDPWFQATEPTDLPEI